MIRRNPHVHPTRMGMMDSRISRVMSREDRQGGEQRSGFLFWSGLGGGGRGMPVEW